MMTFAALQVNRERFSRSRSCQVYNGFGRICHLLMKREQQRENDESPVID
jgi:hypothetical protein